MENMKKIGHVLLLYGKTLLIAIIGELLGSLLLIPADQYLPQSDAMITGLSYAMDLGIWIAVIAALLIFPKERPLLKCLGTRLPGNTLTAFLAGLLAGAAANGICILTAWLHHDIAFSYAGFHPLSFLLIFLAVFIQSGAEELLFRGYLYEHLRHDLKSPVWAVLASALLFAGMHFFNPGFTVLSFINILLIGMFFALSVYRFSSLWFVMAMHTAWNFTQNIVFGLPNSGIVMPYSVFHLEAASNSFAYSTDFGIEGTVMADIVLALLCLCLFLYIRKHPKQDYDPWADEASQNEQH